MPMPRLPATQFRKMANAKPFQLNMNSAARAPTWNADIKNVVIQLICSLNVRSLRRLGMANLDSPGSRAVGFCAFAASMKRRFARSSSSLKLTA